jgi:2TM domain
MVATTDDERELRRRAEAEVEKKHDFGVHAVLYVVVNILLVAIWALTGGGEFWPIWAIGGWGIGLAAHAWSVYGRGPTSEDKIAREMDRLRAKDDAAG